MREAASQLFIEELRDRLLRMYPEQVRECVDKLSDEQLWWRPNPQCNSVGNLILHLSGNLNHYLGRGVAFTGYKRDRSAEFNEKGPVPRLDLLQRFDGALAAARKAFDSLTPERLSEAADLGPESQPIARLLVSVTAHFNGHVGQIIYVTKMIKEGVFDEELWRQVGER